MTSTVRNGIRLAEALVIIILGGIAMITYRELKILRQVPVALPSYQFELLGEADKAAIETRGTWVAERGPPPMLQTTTIECRKSSMQCQESSAVLAFVGDKAVMESMQTTFVIERWDDKEVVTRPVRGDCLDRTLVLNLLDKRASTRVSSSHGDAKCMESQERTLDLVAGYKVRSDALKKATVF